MLTDSKDKSSQPASRLPGYAWLGIAWLVAGEALLVAGVPIVKQWFTPIMWTGYILLVDGAIRKRKGTSLLSDHCGEFALLALISIASWAIFEGYNVLLKNWTYINLPDSWVVRNLGYAWAFATISPAIFLTYEWLDMQLPGGKSAGGRSGRDDVAGAPASSPRLPSGVFWGFVLFGLLCLVVPLIRPSAYMTPLVWMGFAFFLDPINGRLGDRSFLSEFFTGHFRSMPIMFLAGLVCGFLWEFWNYWASSKWMYDVPYLGHVKLFEMPVLGFLGFMPFAVESYAIYVFVRRLIPVKRGINYLG